MPYIPTTYPECVCVCMCVSICMCVRMHMCICACIYVYTQTLQHGEVHKYLYVIRGNLFYVQTKSLLDCVVYLCSPLPLLFPLFCPFFPLSSSSLPPPLPSPFPWYANWPGLFIRWHSVLPGCQLCAFLSSQCANHLWLCVCGTILAVYSHKEKVDGEFFPLTVTCLLQMLNHKS